ncbi:hypothetical protein MMC21_001761 [Puttea exsequens]|nr:hypothetical protein [Puttea exsequens]
MSYYNPNDLFYGAYSAQSQGHQYPYSSGYSSTISPNTTRQFSSGGQPMRQSGSVNSNSSYSSNNSYPFDASPPISSASAYNFDAWSSSSSPSDYNGPQVDIGYAPPISSNKPSNSPREPSSEEAKIVCMHCGHTFKRVYDMNRHYANVHGIGQEKLDCPKKKCARKGTDGFKRNDHLLEHRRRVHRDDIPKNGSGGGKKRES